MTKKLEKILKNIACQVVGEKNIVINNIHFDSRKIGPGDLFVAIKGTHNDGHSYINSVIEKGVAAILCESIPENHPEHITFIKVPDSAEALGIAVSNFFGNPSGKLRLIGVTGTNGKTSIATLLYRVASSFGNKSGLISTVRYVVGERETEATHTTPDPIAIHSLLRQMADEGCSHAFMEVSSHAVDQKRIAGLKFDIAIFTNLTHDHLDYHKTFDAYLKAKKQFFDRLTTDSYALVNIDDRNGRVMVQNTRAKVKTYGLRSAADFKAKILESHFDGMKIMLDNTELWIKLIGEFNASNILAVYGAAHLLGYPKEEVLKVISNLSTVDGRFEYVRSPKGVTAIIDYAHTPDALMNVLTTINQIRGKNSQIFAVIGAGGDRDRTKRPVMAKITKELCDQLILTSDNPRSEDPEAIIREMLEGIAAQERAGVISIADRKEAIKTACRMAKQGDVVLIAGKGHETYQEIKGVKNYFNDKQVVSEIFNAG